MPPTGKSSARIHERLYWLAIALAATISVVAMVLPQTNQQLVKLLKMVQLTGPWGPALFIVIYIVACVLLVPGSVLTIGAGFIFGIWIGLVTVSIGSTLGAGAAFLLARTLMRGWTARKVAGNPRFQALDEAVGRQGFKIVLLTRLSPVLPFNLLNFAFGLTRVSLRDYMLASWIGMLPGAVLYIYIGSAMKGLTELTSGERARTLEEKVLFGFGLAATAVVSFVLARMARTALNQHIPAARHADE